MFLELKRPYQVPDSIIRAFCKPEALLDLPFELQTILTTFERSKNLEDFERKMQLPARSGKVLLSMAGLWLDHLHQEMDMRIP